MEAMSFMVVVVLMVGLVRRLLGTRERTGRVGPGTPAHFLHFTGRRLVSSKRTHAYSPEE
ncbi:MAG: hypothetical protein EPO02_02095 [Nitrospirae bacterium]|nr:MAG: hypothetical protein EPO02_02095 [Nitrospirota bacterium]